MGISVLDGGGPLTRLLEQVPGRVRGSWYELALTVGTERDQHVGMYTSEECPVTILMKTTRRHETEARELLAGLPPFFRYGGYLADIRPARGGSEHYE